MPSLIRKASDLRTIVSDWRQSRRRIGFVPTMGALHDGHASLIRASMESCDKTVVSIFVNPLQFDRTADLESYPRPENQDRAMLEELGVHALYMPQREDMYPAGFKTTVSQSGLTEHLCGASRPGHFSGVLTVVLKLFNAVTPDVAFFGQKDWQQCAVIRRMVADFDLPVEVRTLPTIRDADGLATSSRNRLLTPEQRAVAPRVRQAILKCAATFSSGSTGVNKLVGALHDDITAIPGSRVDYAHIVDPNTLEPRAGHARPADVVAVAVYFDAVRLIDNTVLGA